MIDLHSHVLWGLDDGPKTLEESVVLLRLAARWGTTDIVATPHANSEFRFDPDQVRSRSQTLQRAAGLNAPRLHTGCDLHLTYDNIEDTLAHPRKYTINGRNYLLLEFSELLIFQNTAEILARLAGAGLIPVITHPERNRLLQQRLADLTAWVEQGALVQVTAQSLDGGFGRRAREFSARLLERGLVHFVASDGHDCERRPPRLDGARAWIEKRYGAQLAETLLVENPRRALAGEPLSHRPLEVSRRPRKWYQFLRNSP